MTINEYQQEALLLEQTMMMKNFDDRLIDGLMGLNGEAGEAIDIVKKYLFHGHELDKIHLAKELGDVAWYLAVTADVIGYSLEDILKMNIDKLRKRYPEGFDPERSINRKQDDK